MAPAEGVTCLGVSGAEPGVASSMFCLFVLPLFFLTFVPPPTSPPGADPEVATLEEGAGGGWTRFLSLPPPTSPPGAGPEAATLGEGAGGGVD